MDFKSECRESKETVKTKLIANAEKAAEEITEFVRSSISSAGARGVVVGLSGGVDSSVTAAICARALGSDSVLGVLIPAVFTPQEDMDDAKRLAKRLGIETEQIGIQEIADSFFRALRTNVKDPHLRIAQANIYARIRMTVLYYFANSRGLLVAGSGDRSELLIGYFTKYGDGGADLLPIGHLYKTQVRQMARYLGLPEEIAEKLSSPQLYPGHKAIDEIPAEYALMDPLLQMIFDEGIEPKHAAEELGLPTEVSEEVMRRHWTSEHKRTLPKTICAWRRARRP